MQAVLGGKILALGANVHVGHAQNIHPQALGGLDTLAEGNNGGHVQRGVDFQGGLDLLAVGESEPAAAQIHVGQLQDQILHHVTGILASLIALGRQQNQIVRCADQKALITSGAFQSRLGFLAENAQLRLQLGNQTLAGLLIIGFNFRKRSSGNLLIRKLADRFSVLNQRTVIHGCAS